MKTIISKALINSFSYSEYRKTIIDLLTIGKSTGNEQSDDLVQFSILNETRMHRLDKTIVISDDVINKLNSLKNNYIWLVLSEGWCGDAAQIMPILNKMALAAQSIELKIVFRDENPDLMNLFLTNGAKAIPKLIVLDKKTLNIEANWGPRPKGALELIANYKEKQGKIDANAKTELQLWYLHDKGFSTQNEVSELMISIESEIAFKM
jgi:hypothetical protein